MTTETLERSVLDATTQLIDLYFALSSQKEENWCRGLPGNNTRCQIYHLYQLIGNGVKSESPQLVYETYGMSIDDITHCMHLNDESQSRVEATERIMDYMSSR